MTEQEAINCLMADKEYLTDMKVCDGEEMDIAIKSLEEVKQYRAIGTVEECREAVEKMKAKKPNYDDYHRAGYRCPTCNNVNPWGYKHCKHCGQKLDWRDENDKK